MSPIQRNQIQRTRREFFNTTASGLGAMALGSMLTNDGLLHDANAAPIASTNPLAVRPPHFAPKAKSCIFLFMAGAPSQLDLYDPKPKLNELNGDKLPKEVLDKARFASSNPTQQPCWGHRASSRGMVSAAWSLAIYYRILGVAPTTS